MQRHSHYDGWGPRHQTSPAGLSRQVKRIVIGLGCVWLASHVSAWLALLGVLCWVVRRAWPRLSRWWSRRRGRRIAGSLDPAGPVRAQARRAGVYLGRDREGRSRFSAPEQAVLLLGPPRSGKTSGVIVPSLLAHTGPAVSTSTKPDVLQATAGARSGLGDVWEFSPCVTGRSPGVRSLRWSPVRASSSWDGALMMARAMVTGSRVGCGATDSTHWGKRAAALLAAALHAAALDGRDIEVVCDWVARHELDAAGAVLQRAGARSACGLLIGLQNTEARERSSICSAAMDALDAYAGDAALAAARDPNFDAAAFVRSDDTVYIHAPGEDQALAAPLICGLLSEIRRATYAAFRDGELDARVLWALDEAANIAPLDELPAVASEGAGQGLRLVASFQDLSQARGRWGAAAEGFLTLFGAKLVLPGIADTTTLEAISVALGEYDRRMVSTSRHPNPQASWLTPMVHGSTTSTQRQRVLSPGEIANIPAGRALALDGLHWGLVEVTPAYRCEPWRSLSARTPIVSVTAGRGEDAR